MNPVAIVTGASRGVGAATARWLGNTGALVICVARSADELGATAEKVAEAGGTAEIVCGDLLDQDTVAAVADRVGRVGRLNALVNNAALIEPIERIDGGDADAWRRVLDVNLVAAVDLIRVCLPHLRASGGRVINLSSTAATVPIPGLSAYCVSKAGILQLTRVLAQEEPEVITVAVQPGPVDTGMHVSLRENSHRALTDEWLATYHRMKGDGELASPDVPGRALAWLAIHAPRSMSGNEIQHDDGRIVQAADRIFGPLMSTG